MMGLEQTLDETIGDERVELHHWDRATLAGRLALPRAGRHSARIRLPLIIELNRDRRYGDCQHRAKFALIDPAAKRSI